MVLPFEGIKVIEMGQFAAGPIAGRLLADWGADVIHIEHPIRGDGQRFERSYLAPGNSKASRVNYFWENADRNKKSVTIDLSQIRGREILYRLVETADVFITNMKLSDVRKFGAEYETLSRLNPKLIYACVTGYGKRGPDKDLPGYDSASYFARSGFLHMIQGPGAPPPYPRSALGDCPTAMTLACGIATALYVRERTGIGQEVEVSLYNSAIFALSYDIAEALATGCEGERLARDKVINPLLNFYQTKDGRWLRLAAYQPDPYWSRFCKALGREDLEHDPRFESFEARAQNNVALIRILDKVFGSTTLAEWKPRLDKAVPWSPCQNLLEVTTDPQAWANDFFVTFKHPQHGPIKVVANPIRLSKTPATIRMPAPEFSQHTEEVLLELGYTWDDIGQLKQQRIIA